MIRVIFFGPIAEIIGKREITVDKNDFSTTSDIFDLICETYPKLVSHRLLYSINQEYATGKEIIQDDDELSIFTAVSGG